MVVQYKLEVFEGPLDLLLHLIDKNEVDIYNIPIKEITNQYLDYLSSLEQFLLEPTSEFLVMAAQLLAIKSQMLLPKPPPVELEVEYEEEEQDPREELVRKLIEYRKYKEVADHLRNRELQRSQIFTKEPEDLGVYESSEQENPLKGLYIADLIHAFVKAMRKAAKQQEHARIRRDEISVQERMQEVKERLVKQGGKVLFSSFFDSKQLDRTDVVVTFLAILELMKSKQIICYQHQLFSDIVIQQHSNYNDASNI